ncbi:uncharacterized protein N7496_005770 [Penicillium cataractarum]|uniref:Uncharacterized protein n=1 Tax=Penicillium cataractarum TaxID=2100454 RepID=A0A9W9S0A1_9EURO|nr:uncharacterized protein N7496_005770 [Penicillium cataractarum]KAJ5369678.1 hypothetical protein N7496_005770 [Penicillium cataractarum]
MSKQQTQKDTASGRQQDRESRTSQTRLFTTLGITDAAVQRTVSNILRQIYDAGSGDLRSSIHRNRVRQGIRDRMDKMPAAIQSHSESRDKVVDMLYNLFKLLQAQWKKQPAATSAQQPPAQPQNVEPPRGRFDHSGPSVVPDADVQIVTHDNPGQPFPIRLSDLLPDANNLTNRSEDGDWINASAIRLDGLRQNLINEGYMVEGTTLWWCPHALDPIDPAQLSTPQDGETRLTSMNLASTVRRAISMYYPSHRQPSPDNQDGTPRPPLARPNFTIIIRPRTVTGGVLLPQQPGLARPSVAQRGSVTTGPGTSRVAPATQTQEPSVQQTIGETPVPQRNTRQQPLQASVVTESPSSQAPPTATPAPQRQLRVAAVDDELFDFTVPQSVIDALNAPGPGSGLFEYQGLSIIPRRSPLPGEAQPTTQPTENTGERRRRAPDDEPSTRPARRRRLSDGATTQRDPLDESTGISMTFDAAALPATEGLEETQRLGRALSVPPQPSVARSPPRPLATEASRLRNQAFGTRRRQNIYEQVGEAWLGISEDRMPPQVQEAIANRRVTAEIDQGTELLALTGDPEEASASRPVSAPLPRTTDPVPTEPVPGPRTSNDKIIAARKRRRRFSEYQKRPAESSSCDSQDSPRKKRRINTSSSPYKPSPPKKAKRGAKRAPTEQERLLAGQVRDVSEGVERLSTQPSQSARRNQHRTLSPRYAPRSKRRSSCVTT